MTTATSCGRSTGSRFLLTVATCFQLVCSYASAEQCTLTCPIDAPCKFGDGTVIGGHSHDGDTLSFNGMHCQCPPGWTGVLCDRKYEACHVSAETHASSKSDPHHCYHGGECVSGFLDHYGNEQPYCDCSNAVAADGTRYTGKYCETPFTDTCSDSDPDHFCVNGSACNPNYKTTGGNPCFCADGFEGEHCEFKKGDMPECTLDCGQGRCVLGLRSPEEFDRLNHIWTNEDINAHMHCECPPGIGGPNCQAEVSVCDHADGDDQYDKYHDSHVCYHGGTCLRTEITRIRNNDKDKEVNFHCDCTTAFDPDDKTAKFAGEHCQYRSTSLCDAEGYVDSANFFCVNGGNCPLNPLDNCECQNGYMGSKCEYPLQSYDGGNDNADAGEVVEDDPFDGHPEPVLCGADHVCYNGGECRHGEYGYFCDCTNAIIGETIFAGESCEFPSTTLCSEPDPVTGSVQGTYFCTNNGVCNKHHPAAGCRCSPAFEGLHCEYEVNDGPDDSTDTPDGGDGLAHEGEDISTPCGTELTCLHGSVCTENIEGNFKCDCAVATRVDLGIFYAGDSCEFRADSKCEASSLVPFCVNGGKCPTGGSDRCECHAGFAGDQCEIVVTDDPTKDQHPENDSTAEQCGDTHCFNGGKCVHRGQSTYCDCSSAFDDEHIFSGESCQFPSTRICVDDPSSLASLEGVHFCANHGKCVNGRKACDCGVNWVGKHCEFAAKAVEEDNSNEEGGDGLIHPTPIPCGDTECQNGGVCRDSGAARPYCDCSTATQNPGIFYAGDSCQYPSTVLCDDGSFCANGGKCNSNGGTSCHCRAGWTGDKCEIEMSTDDAVNDNPPTAVDTFLKCGPEHHCYFGGTCVQGSVRGETVYECDCSSAYDASTGGLFDGEFCQYQSTAICRNQPSQSVIGGYEFCVNGGECRENGVGCDCPAGYIGLRCEATLYNNQGDAEDNIVPNDSESSRDDENDGDVDDHSTCNIDCKNGGQCREGAKELGDLADTVEHVAHLNQTHHKDHFEHCVCPKGFTGLTCEHRVEVCGEGEHHCLHGAKCVSDNEQHACDCALADDTLHGNNENSLYAGQSCEHAATDICTVGEIMLGSPLHFCVNAGQCKAYVSAGDPHPGCVCPGDWTGTSCEVHVHSSEATMRSVEPMADGNASATAIAVATVVIVSAIALAVFILLRSRSPDKDDSATCMPFRRRRNGRFEGHTDSVNIAPKQDSTMRPLVRDSNPISSSSDPMAAGLALEPDDEPEVYLGPPRDEDGHELHNVDII